MRKLIILLALFANSVVAQNVPNYVPTNGLIGWWPFNGNANDESGNGNNGTVNGAILTADRFGNANRAYSFDGIDDFIHNNSTNSLNVTSQLTLSAWINTTTINQSRILTFGSSTNITNFQYSLLHTNVNNSNRLYFLANGANTNFEPNGPNFGNLTISSQWTNVVVTFDGFILKFYLNGVLDKAVNINDTFLQNSFTNFIIGKRSDNQEVFTGFIDDIGIWNRALSSQEVHLLYTGCTDTLSIQPLNFTAYTNPGWANFTCKSSDTAATYQWQQSSGAGWVNLTNLGFYSGVNSDSLVINGITGTMNNYGFRCIVTSCDTDTSDVAILTVSNGAGADESSLNSLFLSPNPTSGIVRFNLPVSGTYRITAADGRVIETGEMKEILDLSHFPNGVYTVEVQSAQAQRTFRALKQD